MKGYEFLEEVQQKASVDSENTDRFAKAVLSALPKDSDGKVDSYKVGEILANSLLGVATNQGFEGNLDSSQQFIAAVTQHLIGSVQESKNPMATMALGMFNTLAINPRVGKFISGLMGVGRG